MTNDELIARAEASIAAHEKTGNGDLQRVKDMAALIAALKVSEARVKELEAENQAMKDAVMSSISERMVAAGMVSLEEAVSPDCLTKFNVHSGMTDLDFYEIWLERKAKQYIAMQAAHQTGEHVLDDDMFQYILGKAGMAKDALENYRAALKGGAE